MFFENKIFKVVTDIINYIHLYVFQRILFQIIKKKS